MKPRHVLLAGPNILKTAILLLIFAPLAFTADRLPAAFAEKKFSVNVSDTELKDILRLIAKQADLNLEIDDSIAGKATYSFPETTLEKAMEAIARDHKLAYSVEDGVMYVDKEDPSASNTSSGKTEGGRNAVTVHRLPIRFNTAKDISEKVPKFFKNGETLVVDESANALVFFGSQLSFKKLTEFVEALDRIPRQIMIEAQVVETSKNFLRDVGFRWGETADNSNPALTNNGKGSGFINTGLPGNPNLSGKVLLGWVDGRSLEFQLAAAEASGEAKIISRPKVITLNNQIANIHSGITFNVKTLSSTTTTNPSGGSSSVTGGLTQVTAGLQLQVQPLIVGEDMVRLKVSVTNSEPNDGLAVDGIPGITDNSASTSIIVQNGSTATMAGLIKKTVSEAENKAPFFSKIPLLGWLFSSHSSKDRNNEMVIFLTPRILKNPRELQALESMSREPAKAPRASVDGEKTGSAGGSTSGDAGHQVDGAPASVEQ